MKRFIVPVLLVGCVLAAAIALAAEGGKAAKPAKAGKAAANHYLLVVPHTPEECMAVLDDFDTNKSLGKFDFGCKDNDHNAYAIVTAKTAEDAKAMVPEKERANAKVVELHKYTAGELKEMHSTMTK